MADPEHVRRNFLALMLEGSFFFIGLSFIDVNAVIPVFIFTYTRSMKLAGLATTINLAASASAQILLGPHVNSIRNIQGYIVRMMFIFRCAPLLMLPVLALQQNPNLAVAAFLVVYALVFIGDGLVVVPWSDLLARTIPADLRGRLLGGQQIISGLGCLVTGLVIKSLLDNPRLDNDSRYAAIFACAGVFLVATAVCMLFVRDLPRPVAARPARSWPYYAKLPSYLQKNREFSKMAAVKILSTFAGMTAPFFILYGQDIFALTASQVSTLVYIQIVGGLAGGLLWGQVSHRFGNKHVILTAQVFSLLILGGAFLCSLLRGQAQFWIILWPLVLLNGANMGSWIGTLNYTIDVVRAEERTVYLLLASMITFPLTALTFLAGVIADRIGFIPLFAVAGAAAACAAVLAGRLKTPRQIEAWLAGQEQGGLTL